MDSFIKTFGEIGINDIAVVGGKNASLGEMFNQLSSKVFRMDSRLLHSPSGPFWTTIS